LENRWQVRCADVFDGLRAMADGSVHCVVTSPPYWGLRDYGTDGQLGLEATPEEYVENMVAVFREVRRVLRDDGTVWLNLGDSYASMKGNPGPNSEDEKQPAPRGWTRPQDWRIPGLKPKDLVGIPWRVAFALQADGWYLRSDIVWSKPNPMPESVTDRPTKAHEYVFLLTKSRRYFFDSDAVRQPFAPKTLTHRGGGRMAGKAGRQDGAGKVASGNWGESDAVRRSDPRGANIRTVWTIPTQPFPGAHFAVFPPKLVEPCIKAGCPEGGTVLDPFSGAGTTVMVALRLGRSAIGIELSEDYAAMSRARIQDDLGAMNHRLAI
jgi:site-specific DNA-methyltransferase (cytosine-N4-specific)